MKEIASKEIHLALCAPINLSKCHTGTFETNITSSAIWQHFHLRYLNKGQGDIGTREKKTGGQKNLCKEADWLCIWFKYSYLKTKQEKIPS